MTTIGRTPISRCLAREIKARKLLVEADDAAELVNMLRDVDDEQRQRISGKIVDMSIGGGEKALPHEHSSKEVARKPTYAWHFTNVQGVCTASSS